MQTSETTSYLIGGEKIPSTGTEGIEVLNPATGEQVSFIPAGTAAAVREALPGWSRLPAAERAGLVKAAARKMRERAGELAQVVTLETTKVVHYAVAPRH